MERFPGFLVDFGFEGRPEGFVRVVCVEEVGMAHEEALLVVVGVDEPAGDTVSAVTADFAGVGVEYVYASNLDLDLTVIHVEDVDVGFAEDDEEVAFAGVLEVAGHVEIGIHARLEDRDPPQLVEIRRVGFVVEGAGDQDVKIGVCSLAGGLHEIGTGDGAELRADKDGGALLGAGVGIALDVDSFGADEVTWPGFDPRERDPVVFVRLLNTGRFKVFEDHPREVLLFAVAELGFGDVVDQFVVLINAQHAVRRQAVHRKRSGDADLPVCGAQALPCCGLTWMGPNSSKQITEHLCGAFL